MATKTQPKTEDKPSKHIDCGGGTVVERDKVLAHDNPKALALGQLRFSDAGEVCRLLFPMAEPEADGRQNWTVELLGTSNKRERFFNA